jgi:hypothetical protein
MAHPRDGRVSFQSRDQFGRSHDPNPQEAPESNQKLSEEQRAEITQAVSIPSCPHAKLHVASVVVPRTSCQLPGLRARDLVATADLATLADAGERVVLRNNALTDDLQ